MWHRLQRAIKHAVENVKTDLKSELKNTEILALHVQ